MQENAQYKQKFISDAIDLVVGMEKALLKHETSSNTQYAFNEVFRGLHTLKGTSGMYNFVRIEQIAHRLENVFELIRKGELSFDKLVTNLSLKTLDFISLRLQSATEISESEMDLFTEISNEILLLLRNKDQISNIYGTKTEKAEDSQRLKSFRILFLQENEIENSQGDVQKLFDSILNLGEGIFYSFEKEDGILWEIFLSTHDTKAVIGDVFIFVADKITIEFVTEGNVHENVKLISKVEENIANNAPLSLEKILSFVNYDDAWEDAATEVGFENEKINTTQNIDFIKVDAKSIDQQMTLLSDLIIAKEQLKMLNLSSKTEQLVSITDKIDNITNLFRTNILNTRLVPLEIFYVRMLRLVRDISAKMNKKINFSAEGFDNKIDKNIIENIEGILMHIIKNSIDHGIECPKTRIQKGKPETGLIKIKAYKESSNLFIEISDDGFGLNKEKIVEKAKYKNIIQPNQELTENQIFNLIFHPGLSTKSEVSDVSGRGVGMDAVKDSITKLKGSINIKSKESEGTTFILKLPISLFIVDTLLVDCGRSFYAIPLKSINYCTPLPNNFSTKTINEQIKLNGKLIPFIDLRTLFSLKKQSFDKTKVVVVQAGNFPVALIVDKIIGEHQAVLKPIGEYFVNQPYYSGVSMLAEGNMAIVLDVESLMKTVVRTQKSNEVLI